MNFNSFFREVLNHLMATIPNLQNQDFFDRIISENVDHEVDGPIIVALLEMIAPRFKCDITHSLSRHDHAVLANQTKALLLRFVHAHTRHCKTCSTEMAGAYVFGRFINTYIWKQKFGTLPNFPGDWLYFFKESDTGDYLGNTPPQHMGKGTIKTVVEIREVHIKPPFSEN